MKSVLWNSGGGGEDGEKWHLLNNFIETEEPVYKALAIREISGWILTELWAIYSLHIEGTNTLVTGSLGWKRCCVMRYWVWVQEWVSLNSHRLVIRKVVLISMIVGLSILHIKNILGL